MRRPGFGQAADAMTFHPLTINYDRLATQIDRLNTINRLPDGSCCRLALTDADKSGRDLVRSWMQAAGLEVRIDRIGNIIGVQAGADDMAPVLTGSHIDTVATGGQYDGTLGVLAGLEVIRTIQESGVTLARPLGVVVFTNEEGVRYQPDMMGSLVYAGGLALDRALAATAEDGTVLGDELKRIGYSGSAPCGALRPHAYVELHIEQGPVLDREGLVLGAVENLQGILWKKIVVSGASNHAGTTPMNMRRDAGHFAARTIVFVRELAERMGGSQVGTIGALQLSPNLVNVIPRKATFTVDLRNTSEQALDEAASALDNFLEDLSRELEISVETSQLVRTPAVTFDPQIVQTIEGVAEALGHPARRMTSGAGHDAQMMARICPSGMIFVPSIGGVSHNPIENTSPEHLEIGVNALLQTLCRLASA